MIAVCVIVFFHVNNVFNVYLGQRRGAVRRRDKKRKAHFTLGVSIPAFVALYKLWSFCTRPSPPRCPSARSMAALLWQRARGDVVSPPCAAFAPAGVPKNGVPPTPGDMMWSLVACRSPKERCWKIRKWMFFLFLCLVYVTANQRTWARGVMANVREGRKAEKSDDAASTIVLQTEYGALHYVVHSMHYTVAGRTKNTKDEELPSE